MKSLKSFVYGLKDIGVEEGRRGKERGKERESGCFYSSTIRGIANPSVGLHLKGNS
jgi:hypothetical protein